MIQTMINLGTCLKSESFEYLAKLYYEIDYVNKAKRTFELDYDPENKIDNLEQWIKDCIGPPLPNGDYIDCSNFSGSLSVSIFVRQPNPGTRDKVADFGSENGHVTLSFTITYPNGTSKTLTFGFYPENGDLPAPNATSAIVDDSPKQYHVSLTHNTQTGLTCYDFNNLLINSIAESNKNYNLNNYNCADYAINIFKSAGYNLPDTYGSWLVGGGSNPADLGEDIRDLEWGIKDLDGGEIPNTDCQ